jgi:hypothetical protein
MDWEAWVMDLDTEVGIPPGTTILMEVMEGDMHMADYFKEEHFW